MINFGKFDDWLGEAMAKELQDAAFVATPSSDNILYEYRKGVHITHVDNDTDNREAVLQHYLKFFEEIIEKLELQSISLVGTVAIDDDMATSVLDMLHMFLERAMSGYSPYLTYLDTKAPQDESEYRKSVEVELILTITHPRLVEEGEDESTYEPSALWWMVQTRAWERNLVDPANMTMIRLLENNFEYQPS